MSREEIFENLNEIFRSNFDDEGIELTDKTSSKEQINLVMAIQDRFHVKFNIDEVNAMQNVGEMADEILAKIGIKHE